MIKTFILFMIIFITLAVLMTIFKKTLEDFLSRITSKKKSTNFPYGKEKSLFSPAERSFLSELDQIIGRDYRVFGKIRLADVIKVKSGLSDSAWQSAFNRIKGKHLDFLICKRDDLSIVGAIELDDNSHSLPERRERDVFINGALEAAGVPILRYPLKRKYTTSELTGKLSDTFGPEIVRMVGGCGLFNKETGHNLETQSRISELVVGDYGYCPTCSGKLEKRKIKRGSHAGRFILVCSNYPECRYIKPHREIEKVANGMNKPDSELPAEHPTELKLSNPRFKF